MEDLVIETDKHALEGGSGGEENGDGVTSGERKSGDDEGDDVAPGSCGVCARVFVCVCGPEYISDRFPQSLNVLQNFPCQFCEYFSRKNDALYWFCAYRVVVAKHVSYIFC